MGQEAFGNGRTELFDFEQNSITSNYVQDENTLSGARCLPTKNLFKNNRLKFFGLSVIFRLPNCSCFVLISHMSSTLYQDPSLIIPQRPVRVRFQARRAGFDKARSAMRDFTLLLALAWGAAEMALWLSGG
ncbi:MAG: hypothetical protein ACKO54_20465 [Alphaproteobacteria bacterium]